MNWSFIGLCFYAALVGVVGWAVLKVIVKLIKNADVTFAAKVAGGVLICMVMFAFVTTGGLVFTQYAVKNTQSNLIGGDAGNAVKFEIPKIDVGSDSLPKPSTDGQG